MFQLQPQTAESHYYQWMALLIVTIISGGASLYAYTQITKIDPPVFLDVTRPYPKTIFIDSPKINRVVNSPITITGRAKTSPSGILTIVIQDNQGNDLQKSTIGNMYNNQPLPFSVKLPYSKPATTNGLIKIFESVSDGEQTGQTAIPIMFSN
jgi:hypothetical protein